MPGERILVADDSVAVQELCRAILESRGYKVAVASNGVATLAYPDAGEVDLLVLDTALKRMNGFDTTRAVRTDEELHQVPILLLVPEEQMHDRESFQTQGASAYLMKPFAPEQLLSMVTMLLDERRTLMTARNHLEAAASKLMEQLAERTIQQAVEQRTQIIAERVLQAVVSQVDQRARREVESRVNQLSAEKEQELVKLTVQEVARSMIEKLAERRVTEAMDQILMAETEKAARRSIETMLPLQARDALSKAMEQMLPREVSKRVQKEAENLVPDATQKVVTIIDAAAQKLVPKMAKELVTDLAEHTLAEAIEKQLPRQVAINVSQELDAQVRQRLAPLVREAADRINRRLTFYVLGLIVTALVGVGLLAYDRYTMQRDSLRRPGGQPPAASQPVNR